MDTDTGTGSGGHEHRSEEAWLIVSALYMHALKQQRQDVMCPLFVATQEIYRHEWPPESWPPFVLLLTHLLSKGQSMKTYRISWCIQSSSQAEAASSEVTVVCLPEH